MSAAYFDRVDLSAHGFYITPEITGFGGDFPFNYFTFGASCTEVELDTLTGNIHCPSLCLLHTHAPRFSATFLNLGAEAVDDSNLGMHSLHLQNSDGPVIEC